MHRILLAGFVSLSQPRDLLGENEDRKTVLQAGEGGLTQRVSPCLD